MGIDMNWNAIAAKHFDWVERMGWHNKTTLESLALIASEIGEAANECLDGAYTGHFGEELADIVLRTADLAHTEVVDLAAVVAGATVQWRVRGRVEDFAEVMVDMAKWLNTARKESLGPDFSECMGRVMRRVLDMADSAHVDLQAQVLRKMEINEQRGTRGRRI
jgi:NTP pyrophosphatase (non-canonical NTP hydrolase)